MVLSSGPTSAGRNDRKFYSIERAREVLGYDPQDNSGEYTFQGEPRDAQ